MFSGQPLSYNSFVPDSTVDSVDKFDVVIHDLPLLEPTNDEDENFSLFAEPSVVGRPVRGLQTFIDCPTLLSDDQHTPFVALLIGGTLCFGVSRIVSPNKPLFVNRIGAIALQDSLCTVESEWMIQVEWKGDNAVWKCEQSLPVDISSSNHVLRLFCSKSNNRNNTV